MMDKTIGATLLIFSVSLYVYYTFWVIISPFIDADHFIQGYFPDREYAIIIPIIVAVLGITVIGTFLSLILIKSGRKKQS
mmetsp:Transcript_13018/g.19671  ORF Transcript_13018/g.19671 Transcript_13018/m.19671 type:complete len:80 (+) Transcript_13018:143-382(+)